MFKLSLGKDSKQISCITLICLLLWGCGSTPSSKKQLATNVVAVGEVNNSYDYYFQKSLQSTGLNKQAFQLLALRAALLDGQTSQADMLLGSLSSHTMLTDNHRLELQLLQSIRFALADDLPLAIATLTPQSQWKVPPARLIALYQQRANFLIQNEQPTLAIQSFIDALLLSSNEEVQQQLRQSIWSEYQQLSLEQLTDIDVSLFTSQMQGWHSLALISKSAMHSPSLLREKLTQWALDFPTHAALNNLPERLVAAANVKPYSPKKTAVILPLTGRYSRIGQSVLNGLLANVMATNSNQEITPIDSNELGAQAAYLQAIEQNSEFIIGPLLKDNVELVSHIETLIPTLFLNTQEGLTRLPNQYYFAMDKESETIQGANYIYQLGKEHPVIVAPDNVRGHQMAKLFSEQWLALHENEEQINNVESIFFTQDSKLKETIELLFETDKSQDRINHIRLLVGNSMKSETHSRRDIDAIYLMANPKQASMLMPSVEVTVSAFANKVPVFVGSSGNAYQMKDSGLTHLNQLTISEIPWLLESTGGLSTSDITKLWPKMKQSQLRLFAMGHDAFDLIGQLAQMQLFPELILNGYSGQLSLDDMGKIHREMSWAQFQRGRLKKIQ